MNTTTITHICCAVHTYALGFSAVSALPVSNISTIYPILTATTLNIGALSAGLNITNYCTVITPVVSAV